MDESSGKRGTWVGGARGLRIGGGGGVGGDEDDDEVVDDRVLAGGAGIRWNRTWC